MRRAMNSRLRGCGAGGAEATPRMCRGGSSQVERRTGGRARGVLAIVPAVVLGVATLVSGCARDMVDREVGRLKVGMNHVEASAAIGAPLQLTRKDTRESWQYCWKGFVDDAYLVAWFEDGLLTEWAQESSVEFGDCPTLMESLRWPEDRKPEMEKAS